MVITWEESFLLTLKIEHTNMQQTIVISNPAERDEKSYRKHLPEDLSPAICGIEITATFFYATYYETINNRFIKTV